MGVGSENTSEKMTGANVNIYIYAISFLFHQTDCFRTCPDQNTKQNIPVKNFVSTFRKKPPSSEHMLYIFSAASSCCLSHIASCFCASFSKLTLTWNAYQQK